MAVVYAQQGDTVDALCWRELGFTTGAVEAVLELNRDLADLGTFLPIGTPVQLPERTHVDKTPVLPMTQLWD
jgi:phage tail protein X